MNTEMRQTLIVMSFVGHLLGWGIVGISTQMDPGTGINESQFLLCGSLIALLALAIVGLGKLEFVIILIWLIRISFHNHDESLHLNIYLSRIALAILLLSFGMYVIAAMMFRHIISSNYSSAMILLSPLILIELGGLLILAFIAVAMAFDPHIGSWGFG